MSNGTTHRLAAAVAVGTALAHAEYNRNETTLRPVVGAVLAAATTNLPDLIEPALHPNHRQFFHSVAFAGILGWGAYKVYEWEAEHPVDKAIRLVLLVGAAGYLIHLALDACSPKSLPLIGKI